MPIYSYECCICGNSFEVVHRMSEKLSECEVCDTQTLVRLPSLLTASKKAGPKKAGAIVESSIEEAREEVAQEKKHLAEREW